MTAHDPYPILGPPAGDTPFARGGPIHALPGAPMQITRIEPRRSWRILRTVLAVVGLIALIEAIIIMTFMIVLAGNLGSELDRLGDPDPVVTGCPFGEVECGG